MNTKRAPKVRFKGFTDAWELRKLNEVAEFNPKSALPDTFEYVDLESVVGTDLISHRTESKATAPSRAQRLAQRGDVFYQTVRPYQKNNYLFDLPCNDYVFSTGYAQMRPNIDSRFLFSRIQEERFVKAVLDRCTGTSYPAINANDLYEIEIVVPTNKDEQVKIGSLFRNFDHLITLHQRKLDKTKKLKKAFLNLIFSQKLRFYGFTDSWELRKLEEVAPLRGGYAFQSNQYANEGIPIVRISNILSDGSVGGEFVFHNELKDDEIFMLENGDIVLAMSGATTGKVSILSSEKSCKYYQNQRVGLFSKTATCNYSFVATIVRSEKFLEQLRDVLVAGAQPNVSAKDIDAFDFSVPKDVEEQSQIGNFFRTLDRLITLYQKKIDSSKEMKKILLKNMLI